MTEIQERNEGGANRRTAALVVTVVLLVLGALAVSIVVRANRWTDERIETVRGESSSSRLTLVITSCLQDDRADVTETDSEVRITAQAKGRPSGDCLDGQVSLCLDQPLGDRTVLDLVAGDAIVVDAPPRRTEPCAPGGQ